MKPRLALSLFFAIGSSNWAQTDTQAIGRSGGLSRVPCGPKGLSRNDDFCVYFNGYHWKRLDDYQRNAYIATYEQGIRFTLMDLLTGTNGSDFRSMFSRLAGPLDLDDTKSALNNIYDTPENLGLPISYALELIAARARGRTEAEVQKQTEDFRRLVVAGK